MKHTLRWTLLLCLMFGACAPQPPAAPTPSPSGQAQLGELKTYVQQQAAALHGSALRLQSASEQYYRLAHDARFDYAALWAAQAAPVMAALKEARAAYQAANPQYEQMEGIVAGVAALKQYDLILDAGSSTGEDAVPFDLNLPDGRVLPKPGNLFEVIEATLWATEPGYTIAGIHPDFNGNAQIDLGDGLPDANVLKGAVGLFVSYTAQLQSSAASWQPTEAEAFGALIANVPTFRDFMESWKNSRFVMGDAATERGFVATSRLSDLSDNILSWQKIYAGLSPAVRARFPEQDALIQRELEGLQRYVADLYQQETGQNRRFTPEEVDLFNAEGQRRAASIAGQIAQVAAQLGVQIEAQ